MVTRYAVSRPIANATRFILRRFNEHMLFFKFIFKLLLGYFTLTRRRFIRGYLQWSWEIFRWFFFLSRMYTNYTEYDTSN